MNKNPPDPGSLEHRLGDPAMALRNSEEDLRIVADMSLDMLSRHDLAGVCRWASPDCRQILAIEPESVVGLDAFDFIFEEWRGPVQAALGQLMSDGRSRLQYRIRRTDGTGIWVETLWGLSRDASGNPLEILCSTRDISERVESERRIEELATFNRNLIDTTGGLIVVFDASGRIIRFNRACEDLLGWKEAEVVGTHFFELFVPPERRDRVRKAFSGFPEGPMPERFENDWISRDGKRHWIAWANSNVFDESGALKFIIGTGLDRTSQRHAENEIRELNSSLERRVCERTNELQLAIRELESFSYSISHDLRSPLRAIDGFSKALIEDSGSDLPPEHRTYLDRIRSASQHMGRLIDDLLELSKSSRAEIRRKSVDLAPLANEILDGFQKTDSHRRSVRHIGSDLAVSGDPVLVRSILENLLGNAWKYSSFKPETTISISSEIVDGRKWIRIEDNGIGFDMAHSEKLFGTFHRLHSGEKFEGTGIGLATVHKIVERHGGSVTGHGIPDHGAIFKFTLDPHPGAGT